MKQNEKYKSLEKKIFEASHLPDIACGVVLLLYTVFIMNLNLATHYPLILVVIAGVLFAQFGCSYVTNHLLMSKVSQDIERWEAENMTLEEKTKLFLALHKLPGKKQKEALLYFVICSFGLAAAYNFIYHINGSLNFVSLCSCLLGSYV